MTREDYSEESSSTGPLDVTRAAEDGRFEILIDDADEPNRNPAAKKASSGKRKRWLAAVGVAVLIVAAGTGVAAMLGSGDDESGADEEEAAVEEAPGFQPYAGGSAPSQEDTTDDDESPSAALAASDRPEVEPTDREKPTQRDDAQRGEERRVIDRVVDHGRDWQSEEGTVIGREPDGETIVEDTRGAPMSQREAQQRLERELDSIENADTDYQQRLRRRDARFNSRVIRSIGEDGVDVAPGVQISEDIQKRIQEQFGRANVDSIEVEEGVSADDYRGVDDYYDDEDYYYDDDYYDDEDYYYDDDEF